MTLPETIVLTVKSDGSAAPGIFANITLKMRMKNDYDVVVGPSGPDGTIYCPRSYISNWCDQELKIFQSDYRAVDLEFANEIEVCALNRDGIDRALNGVRRFGGIIEFPPEYEPNLKYSKKRIVDLRGGRLTVEVANLSGVTIRSREVTA